MFNKISTTTFDLLELEIDAKIVNFEELIWIVNFVQP